MNRRLLALLTFNWLCWSMGYSGRFSSVDVTSEPNRTDAIAQLISDIESFALDESETTTNMPIMSITPLELLTDTDNGTDENATAAATTSPYDDQDDTPSSSTSEVPARLHPMPIQPNNNSNVPPDCSQREKLKLQPRNDRYSRIRKCCPIGESLTLLRENQSENLCDTADIEFKPQVIDAILYDNCIEDTENAIELPIEIGNPCNTSFLYNSIDDLFYILQDGSLLLMDEFANETYSVEKEYCIDVDHVSGITYVIICKTSVEERLQRGEILTVAILMLLSIPCLLIVCYLHIVVKELRSVHGLSLSLMSFSLAMGSFLHSITYIYNLDAIFNYAIQFFLLSYIFWFFCICLNVLLNICYKIPYNKRVKKMHIYGSFIIYCVISILGPAILVTMTVQKGLSGMPSYFMQGFTESIRESQRYFIPPVSTLLLLSFCVMIMSYFGFERVKKLQINSLQNENTAYQSLHLTIDREKYEEVKKDAKCISLLGLIMIIDWLFEIVTFYAPGPDLYLMLMEAIIGLQGVFILLIFLVVRRRRTIVFRWWFDRGSHNVDNSVEMTTLGSK